MQDDEQTGQAKQERAQVRAPPLALPVLKRQLRQVNRAGSAMTHHSHRRGAVVVPVVVSVVVVGAQWAQV